jgi:glucose-6-phosphate isomerase
MSNPTTLPAWKKLAAIAVKKSAESVLKPTESALKPVHAAGLYADFSRQLIDATTRDALLALVDEAGVIKQRAAMFAGAAVNPTENRPALHAALRSNSTTPLQISGVDVRPAIRAQLDRVRTFSEAIRSGKIRGASDQKFTDVVNLGIGGSLLGPEFICSALTKFANGPRVHFVSNVDGAHLEDTLAKLNPATTLFTVTSKTFTTDETLTNARSATAWIVNHLGADAVARHFVAVTAAPKLAMANGYPATHIFEFNDWVGGRFSVWSSVGLPIALACGYECFAQLLAGANAMDEHFINAPAAENLPMMLALIGVLNRNFQHMTSHAVLPYAQRLSMLPNHLQQLEMESTGKSVDLDGNRIDYPTCPIIFGQAGTNGQHSFHQLLHQGTDKSSADILLVASPESGLKEHHEKLIANGIAQADAFWQGKSFEAIFAGLESKVADENERRKMAQHRVHPGGRPVTMLVMPTVDAYHLGALVALYEHKVFVQGVIWNINPFDQWGVELGKKIAVALLPSLISADSVVPTHLQTLLSQLKHAASPQ